MPLQEYTPKGSGTTYYVDYRLRQFRSKVEFPYAISFIDFNTPSGDDILSAMSEDGVLDLTRYEL